MLDAGPIVRFDLTDHSHVTETPGGPATVKSEVIASVVGLGNTLHTVQVSVAEGQSSSVFDRFMWVLIFVLSLLTSNPAMLDPGTLF